MLELPDAWIWDFWLADTGREFHVFFLRASRALHDPDRRHLRAGVGHAVSTDLRTWTLVADALVPADEPRFDDLATWTGSVVDGGDGLWRIFYTGVSRAEHGQVQRIGVATSPDLYSWTTAPEPVLVADPRWYATRSDGRTVEEFWRDPWVFRADDGWHMLVTAQVPGEGRDRGVLAHATSTDLANWQAQPPVTSAGAGFWQLEVPQVEVVDGRVVLVFSCLGTELVGPRSAPGAGGSWRLDADSLTGPFDVTTATRLTDERHYSARLVRDRNGTWQTLAFENVDERGRFVGRLSDPMPLEPPA